MAVAAALLLPAAVQGAAATPLEVTKGDAGWTVRATGVRVEDVLAALAEREAFTVVMQLGVERPLVDVDVRDATLDEVLRNVLRGRNYTIGYRSDDDDHAVSRVEVLLPRPPRDTGDGSAVRRADLSAGDAARVAARQQRMREQQVYAQLQRASAAQAAAQRAKAAAQRAKAARPVQPAATQPLPPDRQLWNRIWSGTR